MDLLYRLTTWNKHPRWQKQSWRWILTLMLCYIEVILLFLLIWTTAAPPNKPVSEFSLILLTQLLSSSSVWKDVPRRCVLTGIWHLDDLKSFPVATLSHYCVDVGVLSGEVIWRWLCVFSLKGSPALWFRCLYSLFRSWSKSACFVIWGGFAWREKKSACLYTLNVPVDLFSPISFFH